MTLPLENHATDPATPPIDDQDEVQIDDPVLDAGFTVVPNILFIAGALPQVSVGAKWLYAGLLRYGRASGRCFPGQATLADDLGLSPASITRHLSELKECSLVVVTRRGKTKTNLYRLPRLETVLGPKVGSVEGGKGTPPAAAPAKTRTKKEVDPALSAAQKAEATRVWTAVYSLCGADIGLMTPSAKARAYHKAVEMLRVAPADDIVGCAQYMTVSNGPWWREHPITLEAVEKQLRTWVPEGRPTGHERPAGRGGHRPSANTPLSRTPGKKGEHGHATGTDHAARGTGDRRGDPGGPDHAAAYAVRTTDDHPLF